MLAALTAQRLSQATDDKAEPWGCAAKAHGVDTAYAAASELSLLAGVPGFAADSRLAKARRDLNGLLYAGGIHDSLYRAVGRALITRPPAGAAATHEGAAQGRVSWPVIRSPGSCNSTA